MVGEKGDMNAKGPTVLTLARGNGHSDPTGGVATVPEWTYDTSNLIVLSH